jgi:hypothetical protein
MTFRSAHFLFWVVSIHIFFEMSSLPGSVADASNEPVKILLGENTHREAKTAISFHAPPRDLAIVFTGKTSTGMLTWLLLTTWEPNLEQIPFDGVMHDLWQRSGLTPTASFALSRSLPLLI